MRERLTVPIPPVEQADYDAALAHARAQLDPPAFDAAWAEGAAMTEDQAVTLALEENPAQNPAENPDPKGLKDPKGLEAVSQPSQGNE
jgi:hypothetical protein